MLRKTGPPVASSAKVATQVASASHQTEELVSLGTDASGSASRPSTSSPHPDDTETLFHTPQVPASNPQVSSGWRLPAPQTDQSVLGNTTLPGRLPIAFQHTAGASLPTGNASANVRPASGGWEQGDSSRGRTAGSGGERTPNRGRALDNQGQQAHDWGRASSVGREQVHSPMQQRHHSDSPGRRSLSPLALKAVSSGEEAILHAGMLASIQKLCADGGTIQSTRLDVSATVNQLLDMRSKRIYPTLQETVSANARSAASSSAINGHLQTWRQQDLAHKALLTSSARDRASSATASVNLATKCAEYIGLERELQQLQLSHKQLQHEHMQLLQQGKANTHWQQQVQAATQRAELAEQQATVTAERLQTTCDTLQLVQKMMTEMSSATSDISAHCSSVAAQAQASPAPASAIKVEIPVQQSRQTPAPAPHVRQHRWDTGGASTSAAPAQPISTRLTGQSDSERFGLPPPQPAASNSMVAQGPQPAALNAPTPQGTLRRK